MPLSPRLSKIFRQTVYVQLLTNCISSIVSEFHFATFHTSRVWYQTEFFQGSDAGLSWGGKFTNGFLKSRPAEFSLNSTLPPSSPRAYGS